MSWQQTFVIAWMQFAIGTAVMLGLTRIALRWVSQPVERARLILGMLVAVLVWPLLLVLSPFPSWSLGLISPSNVTSRFVIEDLPRDISQTAIDEQPVVDGASVESKNEKTDSLDPRNISSVTPAPLIASSRGASPSPSVSIASRFSVTDVWSALALAIFLIHLAVGTYFVIERMVGRARLRRLCCSAAQPPESVYGSWNTIAGQQAQNVRLLVSGEVDAPLMFGWLRPVVVIPASIAAHGGPERDACLAHEFSHIERSDILTWQFVNLCQLVLWYQPAFWSLRRELRICQEFLADHRSTSSAMPSLEYSELLFRLAKHQRTLCAAGALTMFDQPSELARRIKMLLENRIPLSDRCRWRFTGGTLLFATLLAITTSCVRIASSLADDESAPPTEQASTPTIPAVENATEPGKSVTQAGRSVSYTQEMVIEGTEKPIITKEYVAEDGRNRTEMADGVVTIFDKNGYARLTLTGATMPKTAHVFVPRVYVRKVDRNDPLGSHALWQLQNFKNLYNAPEKHLGQKELEGKQVNGVIATQRGCAYTIWTDHATGDLAKVEYDSVIAGSPAHITLSNFRFGEKMDESLFSFDAPSGYKVHTPLAVASASDSAEKRAAEAATGMQHAWSFKGSWFLTSAIPGTQSLYALDRLGKLETLDQQGKKLAGSQFEQAKLFRVTDLNGDGQNELIVAEHFGSTVKARNTDGTLLWTYAKGDAPGHDWSVNDICTADLNGDGQVEIIVGFNGSTGLHVLDSQGKVLWKNTTFGNVWHVAAGNLEGDAQFEVVSSAADGKVHLFNAEGKALRRLDAGLYANMVRTWQPSGRNSPAGLMIAAGTSTNLLAWNKKDMVVALDAHEKTHWSLDLPQRVVSATTCQQKPWLALTLADGTARVIDVVTGKEIARVGGQGEMTDSAWLPTDQGDPLLVIANGAAIEAYRIGSDTP